MSELSRKHIATVGKSFLLLLLIFTISSCEEPVELDIEGTEPKVVLNAHFSPDELFKVYVSTSIFPYSEKFYTYPENAKVQIYKDNEVLETLSPVSQIAMYPPVYYESKNIKPEKGVVYTMLAELPDFQKVNASSSIPEPTEISSVSISNITKEFPGKESDVVNYVFELDLELEEPKELPAYYHLDINYEWVQYVISVDDTIRTFTGEYNSFVLENENIDIESQGHYDKGILIKQETPDKLQLSFKTRTPTPIFLTEDLLDLLYVDLRTVSEDYYLHHVSLSRQYEYYIDGLGLEEQDDLDDLNDPVLLYNNVNNGYGIFAGFSLYRDSIHVNPE